MKTRYGKIYSLSSEDFKEIALKSSTLKEMLDYIGLGYRGHSYETLKERLKLEGLELPNEHIPRKQVIYENIRDVLIENSPYVSTNTLKKRLIKEGILENKCSLCGQPPIHNGNPLSLQMDHINGIHDDHRLENLRILCPNCHSQTDTYAGKSANGWSLRKYIKKSNKSNKPDEIITGETNVSIILGGVETSFDDFSGIVRNQIASDICQKYGITLKVLRSICKELKLELQYKKRVTKFQISKEELEELLKTTPKETIGKMFGVSGKAIAKRCIALGINTGDMRGYWMKVRANSK